MKLLGIQKWLILDLEIKEENKLDLFRPKNPYNKDNEFGIYRPRIKKWSIKQHWG